jgi:hypothetical protein
LCKNFKWWYFQKTNHCITRRNICILLTIRWVPTYFVKYDFFKLLNLWIVLQRKNISRYSFFYDTKDTSAHTSIRKSTWRTSLPQEFRWFLATYFQRTTLIDHLIIFWFIIDVRQLSINVLSWLLNAFHINCKRYV